jgi:hypothetical protein
VEEAVVSLHQSAQPTSPQLSACLFSVFCPFSISHHSQLGFYDELAQASGYILKREEILTPATVWMNAEDIMLSEISHSQKATL